jgi:hypothetical protein
MNKIAAYEIALERIELEKRASYLVDVYGTCDGYMPASYLEAFDLLEKEGSIFSAIGKGMTHNVARLGKGIMGTKGEGLRHSVGSAIKDFGKKGLTMSPEQLANVGKAGVGAAGVGTFGTGIMAGRMSKRTNNNNPYQG